MFKYLKKISSKIGVDQAIAFTILSRVIQAFGGVVSIIFIAKFLSANEQGYYYTFASILAIQVFFELGLTGIITQFTAHEFAHLKWNEKFDLVGEEYYKSRLSSLLRFCVKWFGIISILLFFFLLAAGFYFFSRYNNVLVIEWKTPWVLLCIATSLNLFIDPLLSFFDGLGEVKDMAKVRLIQKSLNVFLLFLFFTLGFKLYSSALASLGAISINYIQIILTKRLKLLKGVWVCNGSWEINYYKEIFPFQWRIALSWISGYFIFQLFNPILFATEGAIVAGQMGMTLAALNGAFSISLSWINTKIPLFSSLIAKSDYVGLDKIFNNTLKQASFVCLFLLIIIISAILILQNQDIPLGNRFLSWLPLMLLGLATFINQLVFGLATYLRCHKQEPFLIQSIVLGILTTFSTVVFGNLYGINGITISYTSLIIFVSLTWTIYTFNIKKIEWH